MRVATEDKEEYYRKKGHKHTCPSPSYSTLFVSMFSCMLTTYDGKDNGWEHTDDRKDCGYLHVAEDYSIQKSRNDGLRYSLLGNLVTGTSDDKCLKSLVSLEKRDHISDFNTLFLYWCSHIIHLIVRSYTDTSNYETYK